MFDEKEQSVGLGGVTVQDAWIGLQLLDKAAGNGVIQPTEFAVLGTWRTNMVEAIQRAVGKNYDEEVAKLRQAMLEQQQAEQQAALDAQKTTESANT